MSARRRFLLLLPWVLGFGYFRAAKAEPLTKGFRKAFANAARDVKKANALVTAKVISEDKETVEAAVISEKAGLMARGYGEEDVSEVFATGWKFTRLEYDATSPVSEGVIKAAAFSLGKVRIESKPSGAAVSINGLRQDWSTNRATWLPPGRHKIALMLDGFEPAESECEIREGFNPTVAVALAAKPKRPAQPASAGK